MPRSSPSAKAGTAQDRDKTPSYGDLLPHAELLRILDDLSDSVVLDVGRAALVLGVSVNTLNHWRSAGRPPPFVKLGRGRVSLVRYRLGELRKYLGDNTFDDTTHALEAAARLMHVEFERFLPGDAEPIDDEPNQHATDSTKEERSPGGKPTAPPPRPPASPPTPPPVVHNEQRRDDMLDAVAPFWVCKPFVLDTALSMRADFLEHFLSERIKVEWLTWRKALGRLWLERSVWERRIQAARVNRAGPDLAEVIHEHERLRAREGVPDDRTMVLKYLGLRPREGVEPDSEEVTSYIP